MLRLLHRQGQPQSIQARQLTGSWYCQQLFHEQMSSDLARFKEGGSQCTAAGVPYLLVNGQPLEQPNDLLQTAPWLQKKSGWTDAEAVPMRHNCRGKLATTEFLPIPQRFDFLGVLLAFTFCSPKVCKAYKGTRPDACKSTEPESSEPIVLQA